MPTTHFEQLEVWKQAHAFVLWTYDVTKRFPREELFALTSQLRRAAVSIPANIAEGYKKTGLKDKLRFYNIAQGSLEECRYYLILSKDLNYLHPDAHQQGTSLLESTSRLLNAYCRTIRLP